MPNKRSTPQLVLALPRPARPKKRGRPRGRTKVAHERREIFTAHEPSHVTLRVVEGLRSLRRHRAIEVVRRSILLAQRGGSFRVCHFNLLSNHLHFVVEAESPAALARGMQGFGVRLARGLNHVLGRKGKLFIERYHARVLRSPRQVRNVLRYVLLNARHHAAAGGHRFDKEWVDPYSSGAWFDGWRQPIRADEPWLKELLDEPCPTAPPVSWLLRSGWRRGGLLAFDEMTAG
jgi:REP element-mobilizing transposase RayT